MQAPSQFLYNKYNYLNFICGAQKRGSMPYQGPWSKSNHGNNNILATHKHNASALFWYTQRYHDPRTEEHGSPAGVTVPNAFSRVTRTRTGPPYHTAPRLGPRAFSISVVDSFGGNFVWVAQLRKQTLLSPSTYGCHAD